MNRYLVAVIDGTKARFLTLKPSELPGYDSGPHLIEHEALLSSNNELQGQELGTSSKTGRNRGVAGQAHSYEDRRDNQMIEFERRFTQSITVKIVNLIQAHQIQQLLMIAEPRLLSLIRESLIPILPRNIKIHEIAKELCHLKPHELHEYLASKKLLPPYKRASL
ncbi:host attachment protein [Nostoc sp. 106C]|jgi:protein required for attachment to host cells|uniref:host attachment protein n=1 Tax=Nostoc sp. 106C TaxID=1932667 RepID=UPI000A3AE523|nr:host attachment protein [Nostoc sp. 106C]OUL28589.1 host attachment protein [Nostoc sp. RF31YmG]OUL33461.1 host attachment protein [Nostoc sp. 106C]